MYRNSSIGVLFSGSPSSTPQQLTWLLGGARVELGGLKGPNVFGHSFSSSQRHVPGRGVGGKRQRDTWVTSRPEVNLLCF